MIKEIVAPHNRMTKTAKPLDDSRDNNTDSNHYRPQIGSVWRNTDGELCTVEGITAPPEAENRLTCVVYRDVNGRPNQVLLARWFSVMSFVSADETKEKPTREQWLTLSNWLDRRRNNPHVMLAGRVSGDVADLLRELFSDPLAAAPATLDETPLFWVRLLEDGCYEGPVHDSCMREENKRSGAWTPLFAKAR